MNRDGVALRVLAASCFAFSFAVTAAEPANEIVERMLGTYASAKTYSDSGTVLVHMGLGDRPDEVKFETVFSRPNLFRFSWTTHHPYPPLRHLETHSVIWSDGHGIYTRLGIPPDRSAIRPEESLSMAVAGATGVSSGAAHTVSSLLMQDIGGLSFRQLQSPTLAGVEKIDEVECNHVKGELPRIGPVDIWIGVNDHLVRKFAERLGGILTEELRRDVHVDETIPAERFAPGPADRSTSL